MDRNEVPVIVLNSQECWKLLRLETVGRLVTHVGDIVDIVPLNFVVDDESIVFRSAAGSKLAGLTVNSSVLLEVDRFTSERGWSVVVHGRAEVLEREAEIAAAAELPLTPMVSSAKPTFVRINVDSVRGRRFLFEGGDLADVLQEG
ncbi:nitroimidazol reductase NimA-like FMN-containing flavoprotein (pyridoxamine 5'-phosphate oxidase superfamily) [Leucobacter exalbidus]|uniref:Nitroimidazol reductase NimA-like FMN-containing flavoprotein (Pyridoxamine 5'-phosphate oxidase superfamily) n=1 Tax=Leucobacter exalbidus TaxID=662960 RepID=A0A940T0I3_9MICO|nr:pyridoxamine 5'-phosphate oxidase family protein [Leucobacter exalbidus]MBP1325920.1 nitroimidazol reductase NimA-like FMN-containing flavoprotein (pyridoxamine 5'-phosphate oxidase superfamily) [Leucobacter exalbidus]